MSASASMQLHPEPSLEHVSPRRLLVVANETIAGPLVEETILFRAAFGDLEVLVVCPAGTSRLRHWTSDVDAAVVAARERLDTTLARLARGGIAARGAVGDADPVQAMEDALRFFRADEILLSTHPHGRSRWLERDVVARACLRFGLPVLHVVGDGLG